jgi:hypothetical protein
MNNRKETSMAHSRPKATAAPGKLLLTPDDHILILIDY